MKIRNGPAAVIGDESCEMPLMAKTMGKAQPVGRTESQKTCLNNAEIPSRLKGIRVFVE